VANAELALVVACRPQLGFLYLLCIRSQWIKRVKLARNLSVYFSRER
jgi:hypothetical protein